VSETVNIIVPSSKYEYLRKKLNSKVHVFSPHDDPYSITICNFDFGGESRADNRSAAELYEDMKYLTRRSS
jgi:hypothetical protein